MREIKEIHIHCSATKEGLAITAQEIRKWHLARGWSDIGYNYFRFSRYRNWKAIAQNSS